VVFKSKWDLPDVKIRRSEEHPDVWEDWGSSLFSVRVAECFPELKNRLLIEIEAVGGRVSNVDIRNMTDAAAHDSQWEIFFEVTLIPASVHEEIPELDPIHRLTAIDPLDGVAVDNYAFKHLVDAPGRAVSPHASGDHVPTPVRFHCVDIGADSHMGTGLCVFDAFHRCVRPSRGANVQILVEIDYNGSGKLENLYDNRQAESFVERIELRMAGAVFNKGGDGLEKPGLRCENQLPIRIRRSRSDVRHGRIGMTYPAQEHGDFICEFTPLCCVQQQTVVFTLHEPTRQDVSFRQQRRLRSVLEHDERRFGLARFFRIDRTQTTCCRHGAACCESSNHHHWKGEPIPSLTIILNNSWQRGLIYVTMRGLARCRAACEASN